MYGKSQKSLYKPINEEKYIGNPDNIVCRSRWERLFAKHLDRFDAVKSWASEEFHIPYISPVDGKYHRYFPDYFVEMKNGNKMIVEIKPYEQSIPPKKPKRKSKYFEKKLMTYYVNMAKWDYARRFAKERGMHFIVMTEHELKKIGIKL